jgi:hypothetical protein
LAFFEQPSQQTCRFKSSCCALDAAAKPRAKTRAETAASKGSLITITDAKIAKQMYFV